MTLVEVCVASAEHAIAAAAAGAGRVELCANLVEGGTTPSWGEIVRARASVAVPVMVMIRPRGGDFLYSDLEIEIMASDIEAARRAGADGIVLGLLTSDGRVDAERLRPLVDAGDGLEIAFHRAFDLCRDPFEALETIVDLGCDRILTSGQRATAVEGLESIAALAKAADGRVGIMPGGGIRAGNVTRILSVPEVCQIHVYAGRVASSRMAFRREGIAMGRSYAPDEYRRTEVDGDAIRAVVAAAAHP